MAWSTGTATDWRDLLDILRAAAVLNGWVTDRYATSVLDANNDEWIAHGTGGGSDAIYAGIRTFHDASSGAYNWELAGGTGYNSGGAGWDTKLVGISPGRFNGATDTLKYGAYVPLLNSSITYWISATSRRLILVAKCSTAYVSCYLGWLNPFATTAEYPYPLYIAGSTPFFNLLPSSTAIPYSGLADPIGVQTGALDENGPAFLRFLDGAWYTVRNSSSSGPSFSARSASRDRVVYPAGTPLINATRVPDPADRWQTLTFDWHNVIPNSGVPGTISANLHKTPGTTSRVAIEPATVIFQLPSEQFCGELDDVAWCSGADSVGAEDTLNDGVDTWHVFQNGTKTDLWHRFAVREV